MPRPIILTDESGAVVGAGFNAERLIKSMSTIEAIRAMPAAPTPLRKGALGPNSPRRGEISRADLQGFTKRQADRLARLEGIAAKVGKVLGRKI